MPKIPVYERQVELAAGSLGPRAGAGLEAPGQALSSLGKQVGDIAFRFGMAEKEAETEKFANEAKTFANQQFNNFTNESQATTVPDYQNDAKAFADKLRQQKLEPLRDKLTRNQFRKVESEFNNQVAAKIATGSQQAFAKHQTIRVGQVEQTIEDTMSQMRGLDPSSSLYQQLQKNLDDGFDRWAAQGLKIRYNKGSYRRELSASSFEVQLNGANSQSDIDKMRSTLEADRANMTAQEYATRTTAITAQEKVVDDIEVDAVYDQIVNESQETFLDIKEIDESNPDSAVSKIRRGETLEVTNNAGEVVTVDFNAMKPRNRDFLIAKIKARHNSDKSATLSANLGSINAKINDMSLAELRDYESKLTLDTDGKPWTEGKAYAIAPDITGFGDRQTIARLVNAEIAEKATRVIGESAAAERELVAQINLNDGEMTDDMQAEAARISTNLRNAEQYAAADTFDLEIASSSAASSLFKSIEFESVEKQKAVIDEAYKGRGTAQGARTYEILQERIAERKKRIEKDFVGYFQEKNPDSEITPRQLIQKQIDMGVLPLDARVTSNAELNAFKAQYDAAETYDEKAKVMDDFLTGYGEHQNRVMRHLITTGQISLAENLAASDPENVNMKSVLAGNTKEGQDRIKSDVSQDDRNAIQDEVFTLIRDYTSSVVGGITDDILGGGVSKGRASHIFEMRDIILNTAGYIKALYPDKSAQEVAAMAYETAIGGKFVFGDINGSSVRFDSGYNDLKDPMIAVLDAGLKEDREHLAASIQYPPVPEARVQGLDPASAEYQKQVEIYQNEYVSDLMREGTWRTSTDNKSVYLVDQTGNVVRKREGAGAPGAPSGGAMDAFITVPMQSVASLANSYLEITTGTTKTKKQKLLQTRKLY